MQLHSTPDDAGTRVDAFLAGPLGSRSRAQRLLDARAVLVDGVAVAKSFKLAGGELLDVDDQGEEDDPEAWPDAGEPASFAVAWEDEHLLVVDKPAGVGVHPARGHRTGTLAQALTGRALGGEEAWRAGIVHRLDRDTSGLLVVAKSEAVHRALKDQMAARDIARGYVTLVVGRPPARSGTIDAPIGRDRTVRTRHSTDTDEPREARTHFELAEALPRHTLLDVRLETGRTHQIRVHLQAIGHPLVGDPEYGAPGADALGLDRQFLHAARLSFTHPVTGADIACQSPLPSDLAAALERARG